MSEKPSRIRTKSTGDESQWARLCRLRADAQELKNRVDMGELIRRDEMEAGHAEMREVIRADMLGALPLRISLALADHAMPARDVRAVVLECVRETLASWAAGNIPVPDQDSPAGFRRG